MTTSPLLVQNPSKAPVEKVMLMINHKDRIFEAKDEMIYLFNQYKYLQRREKAVQVLPTRLLTKEIKDVRIMLNTKKHTIQKGNKTVRRQFRKIETHTNTQ